MIKDHFCRLIKVEKIFSLTITNIRKKNFNDFTYKNWDKLVYMLYN